MKEFSFERLEVWRDAKALTVEIYTITKDFPDEEKFGLVKQIRRAIISVSSNIAEGSGRTSPKDQAHFYQMAFSSLLDVLSQLLISIELGFINKDKEIQLHEQIIKISNKLNSLRKSILN
jgi:four helix bundle protein